MSFELALAVGSALVALVTAALSARWGSKQSLLAAELERQAVERARQAERQDVMSRYRDPLLWAAFDLQSRLYNMASGRDFLSNYYRNGSEREQRYAVHSTLHVLAEYLGWVEVLRRRVQFLDLGNREDNRALMEHLFRVSRVFNSDRHDRRQLLIFRSDQRAIGELMILSGEEGDSCLGYAAFCARLEADAGFAAWFDPLTADIRDLARLPAPHPRLVLLHQRLMDLIDFLDPEAERFPEGHRARLDPARLLPRE